MPIIQIWLIQRANITNWPGVDRMETLKGIARFSEHSGVQSKVFQIIRSWMGCFSARSARYSQSGEVVSETECKTGNGTYHEVSTSYLPTKESPLPCSKQYSYDIRRRVQWRRPQLMLCGRLKGIHGFVTPDTQEDYNNNETMSEDRSTGYTSWREDTRYHLQLISFSFFLTNWQFEFTRSCTCGGYNCRQAERDNK